MDDLLFGLRTTVLGMAFVFAILAIVWGLLTVLGRLDAAQVRRAAGGVEAEAQASEPVTGVTLLGAPADLDPALVAAVTIAVLRHEETRRLQAAPAMRSYWPGSLLFASRWVSAGRTRQGQSWRPRR